MPFWAIATSDTCHFYIFTAKKIITGLEKGVLTSILKHLCISHADTSVTIPHFLKPFILQRKICEHTFLVMFSMELQEIKSDVIWSDLCILWPKVGTAETFSPPFYWMDWILSLLLLAKDYDPLDIVNDFHPSFLSVHWLFISVWELGSAQHNGMSTDFWLLVVWTLLQRNPSKLY